MAPPDKNMHPLHADEIDVDESLVEALLHEQCPRFANLELAKVESAGTDNWLFRLGRDMLVRLPRRPSAELQIAKEHKWLPRLALGLPLHVPTPLQLGTSSAEFPWQWSIYSWIEGEPAGLETLAGSRQAAARLGRFVKELQCQDARLGPPPGEHNSFRGEALGARDESVRQGIQDISDVFNREVASKAWNEALSATPHQGAPKWVHGDLLQSNLLIVNDDLVAVIDFGLLGAGDPACDFMAGWTLFNSETRKTFREAAEADDAAWSRGRGWALAFAAVAYPYYRSLGHPLATVAARTMTEVLASQANGAR